MTTSHQCYGSYTDCQFVSEWCSRSWGSCISCSSELLPCTLWTILAFCRTLVVALRSSSIYMWKLHMQQTHNKLGDRVSWPLVLDCGMTFQLDCTSQDCPQVPSDDLQNLIYLATAAPSDSFELIGAYNNVIYIPKFRLTVRKTHLPIGWASYRSNTRLSSHPSWILCEY